MRIEIVLRRSKMDGRRKKMVRDQIISDFVNECVCGFV